MRYCVLITLLLTATYSHAQQRDSSKISRYSWQPLIGLTAYNGSVYAHAVSVQNVEGSHPYGFAIDFARHMNDNGTYQLTGAYPIKGISVAYFNYGNSILGEGYVASYFLEPVYRLGTRLNFHFRGSVGAGYLTNPFDSVKNAVNKNYSYHLNPYLQVGTGFGYRLSPHISLSLDANFQHMSNGNFRQPNAGLNWITGSTSLLYYPSDNRMPPYVRVKDPYHSPRKATLDIGVFYVPTQNYNYHWLAQRELAAGLFAQLSKQVSRLDALTLGAEVYHNEMKDAPGAPLHNSDPSLLSGIYFGHDFLLGRIVFSQQLGLYVTPHPAFFTNFYERWGLGYRITRHWQAGVSLKVHTDEADFVDARVSYRL